MNIDTHNYENILNKSIEEYSENEIKITYALYDVNYQADHPGNKIDIIYSKKNGNMREILYCSDWVTCINKGVFHWSRMNRRWHMMAEM
jgi:hypothetical protein